MSTNVATESESVEEAFVSLHIGDRTFRVKKSLLMSKMKYFEAIFTTDMREKNQNTIVLDPEIVQPEVFSTMLDDISITTIDFAKVDFRALYRAADYLQFEELNRKIELYMTTESTIRNVVLHKQIAIEFNLEELEQLCNKFIMDNMNLNIDRTQLIPLISYDELVLVLDKLRSLSREEDMFYYAIDWVSDLENERKKELVGLMKNIPLEALSFTFLKDVVSKYELIRKDNECCQLLLNAIIDKPRGDVLYAIGGIDETALESLSVSQYDITTRKWTSTTPMPIQRVYFGCAVIGHKIYVCGGYEGNLLKESMNSLTVFNTHSRTWTELTPMKHARQRCAAAVLNGQIYVAGGWQVIGRSRTRLDVVERYCPQTDCWEDVAPMIIKRIGPELVALDGFLYAISGWDGYDTITTVERYDPQTNQWTLMRNHMNKYHTSGSAVLNGYIYVEGSCKCEVYSPTDDKWTVMPYTKPYLGGKRLAVYDGKLYAIGGFVRERKEHRGTKTVEVFDFQASVWRSELNMDVARAGHEIAVVRN